MKTNSPQLVSPVRPSRSFSRRWLAIPAALLAFTLGAQGVPNIVVEPSAGAGPALDAIVAWGNNTDGQTTVPAAAQSGVIAIAEAGFHTAALKSDGSVVAWGLIHPVHLRGIDGHAQVFEIFLRIRQRIPRGIVSSRGESAHSFFVMPNSICRA